MTRRNDSDTMPVHDQLSLLTRSIELSSILIALSLAVWHVVRFARSGSYEFWWSFVPIMAGWFTADFVSGLVHWTADTWGSETMPILGRRFVRPFRVHHVNPHDFLKRDVIDTNGDVAMIAIPFLTMAFWLPLNHNWGEAGALWLVAFCIGGLPTNQVHQWAHMRVPPRWVRPLQEWGILLRRTAHQQHHASPYVVNYCIATGWCNPLLTAIDFFPRLERLVSRITGWQPRCDDSSFAQSVFGPRLLPDPRTPFSIHHDHE